MIWRKYRLTAAEEVSAFKRWKAGSEKARETLILGCWSMAEFMAAKWNRVVPQISAEDFLSAGLIGILKSLSRIDLRKMKKAKRISRYVCIYANRYMQNHAQKFAASVSGTPKVHPQCFVLHEEYDEDDDYFKCSDGGSRYGSTLTVHPSRPAADIPYIRKLLGKALCVVTPDQREILKRRASGETFAAIAKGMHRASRRMTEKNAGNNAHYGAIKLRTRAAGLMNAAREELYER